MNGGVAIPSVLFPITLLLFLVYALFRERYSLIVGHRFISHIASGEALKEARLTLKEVNRSITNQMFVAELACQTSLKGHRIVLVVGSVGTLGSNRNGPIWLYRKRLFAIVSADEVERVLDMSLGLSAAYVGPNESIVWIRSLSQLRDYLDSI